MFSHLRFRALCAFLMLAAVPAMSQAAHAAPRHVIVIAMENKDSFKASDKSRSYVYGNADAAPYLNHVLPKQGARALNYIDDLPGLPSQPHYIEMEAGTNEFADTAFTCDRDPGKKCDPLSDRKNWTESRDHLTAQLEDAGRSWMTYQEGIDPQTTGACPVHSDGFYAVKHNPFVYFADVAGAPPSGDNANCIAHTRRLSNFMGDMQSGKLADYVFITPDLCHDMHGASDCEDNLVAEGDAFLAGFLPRVVDWSKRNDAVIFLVWDEGKRGLRMPFYALGSGVKQGYESKVEYSHRSVVKTVERIFGLPTLPAVKDANDLEDMFEPGVLP